MLRKIFMTLIFLGGVSFSASACDMSGKGRALLARHKAGQQEKTVLNNIARRLLQDANFAEQFAKASRDIEKACQAQGENQEEIMRHNDIKLQYWQPEENTFLSKACSR